MAEISFYVLPTAKESARLGLVLKLVEKAYEAREPAYLLFDDKEFMKEYGYFLTEEGLHKEAIEILEKYNQLEPFDEETTSFLERLKFSINE